MLNFGPSQDILSRYGLPAAQGPMIPSQPNPGISQMPDMSQFIMKRPMPQMPMNTMSSPQNSGGFLSKIGARLGDAMKAGAGKEKPQTKKSIFQSLLNNVGSMSGNYLMNSR